jgi:isopentenyl phosphate kinase
MQLFIVKIGGSVCTDKKSGKFLVKKKRLQEIAKEIKKAGLNKKFKLILVHGAGPFGHVLAKKYKLSGEIKSEKQMEGVFKVQESMQGLNDTVVKIFQKQKIDIMGVPTHLVLVNKNKHIQDFDVDLVRVLLKENVVPCLYGDVVFDSTLGASIVSGDDIVPWLAKELKAKKVFYGTDVAGIYTGDPQRNKTAKHIAKIDRKNYAKVLKRVGKSHNTDVTGGMKGKIQKMRKTLKNVPVTIFDMQVKGNTYKALKGKLKEATRVKF